VTRRAMWTYALRHEWPHTAGSMRVSLLHVCFTRLASLQCEKDIHHGYVAQIMLQTASRQRRTSLMARKAARSLSSGD